MFEFVDLESLGGFAICEVKRENNSFMFGDLKREKSVLDFSI